MLSFRLAFVITLPAGSGLVSAILFFSYLTMPDILSFVALPALVAGGVSLLVAMLLWCPACASTPPVILAMSGP